jgi:hypothetical protein
VKGEKRDADRKDKVEVGNVVSGAQVLKRHVQRTQEKIVVLEEAEDYEVDGHRGGDQVSASVALGLVDQFTKPPINYRREQQKKTKSPVPEGIKDVAGRCQEDQPQIVFASQEPGSCEDKDKKYAKVNCGEEHPSRLSV